MKYKKIYNQLISNAKSRQNLDEYEIHHIIPKCIGGSNKKDNLVKLTLREHFLAHKLLTKMFEGESKKKMHFAFYRLSNRHKITNGRFYETSKKQVRKYLSEIHSGKTISQSHKQAIREKCRGMVGKNHTEKAITKMKKAKVGNTHAKVGVRVLDLDGNLIEELPSIKHLRDKYNLTPAQAEYRLYNRLPYEGFIFERKKIIKRK
jgi:hypothetical protein